MPMTEDGHDLPRDPLFRAIPGAPPGVSAVKCKAYRIVGQLCTGCGQPFNDPDEEIWFCDRTWLGTKKHGLWHDKCLKQGGKGIMSKIRALFLVALTIVEFPFIYPRLYATMLKAIRQY